MTIEEIYTKCSEALSEYLKDNATKGDLPSDYVPLYKYLHSKNITIEDWNTLVKYVESTLSSDITFDKNIRTLYELLSTTLQTAASKEDVENVINDVKASIKDLDDRKLDKITSTATTDRVYGIAAAGTQRTFNVSKTPNDGAVAQFNPQGNLQSNNPVNDLDVVNKHTATSMVNEGVDSIVSQVIPSSDVAQYIQYTLKKDASEYNGAYARALETTNGIWIVANNSLYKVNLNNLNNGDNSSNFTLETISTEILNTTTDPDTVERTNIQISEGVSVDAYICYRVKRTDGSYEIRIRAMDCSNGKVFDYTTVATNTDFGLYEPFICDNYIFYSKEIDAETQDIVFKKFKYNYDTDTFTVYAKEYVLCSGTNQKDDLGNIIPKSRPGFSVVVNVLVDNKDYRYLMLFETNVNNSKAGYPYVIQYMYFKFNGEDSATISGIDHTEPKTLLKSKGEIVNIPYIDVIRDLADAKNCRYVITYHTTEGYYGNIGDGDGIHKKIFRAMISKNHIMSGTTLRASDFVDLHTRDVHSSEWSGGWGSVCATRIFNTKRFCLLYASGYNSSSTSVQQTFNITLVQDLKQYIAHYLDLNSSTAVDGDTLAKRTSRGFLYAATATDLNANSNPDIVATKGFVGKYVAKKMSNVYSYKGSVQTYAKLPTNAKSGDVYNVIEAYQDYPAGTNFAWNGTQWDALGGSVDLSNYPTKQEVATDLSSKLDKVTTTATSNRIYAIAPNGSQYTPKLTSSVVNGEVTVPIRDANGNFKVGTPKVDGDAANMKFVNDSLSTKADKQDTHDDIIKLENRVSEQETEIESLGQYAQNTQQELNELKASLYGYVFGEDTANFSKLDISALPSMINNNNVAYNTRLMLDTIKGRSVKWTQLIDASIFISSRTISGVTFTFNKTNGTITVNGTATEDIKLPILGVGPSLYITPKTYIYLKGCPSGGSESTYYLNWGNYEIHDLGNGVYRQLTSLTDTTLVYVNLYIVIKSGTTMTNKVFRPQYFNVSDIYGLGKEPKTIADFNKDYPYSIYPYGKQEILTTKVSGIKIRAGYKNLINVFADTQTISGVTFTKNNDGTYTVNGTASADIECLVASALNINVSSNRNGINILLQGCPANGSTNTYYLRNNWSYSNDTGNGIINYVTYNVAQIKITTSIIIKQGTTCNNLVFKPQLINLTDTYGAGNEPTTPAQFNQDFPDIDNIPYPEQTISFDEQTLYGINDVQDTLQVVKENDGYKLQRVENIGNVDLGTLTWANGKTEDSSFIKAYLPMLNATYGTFLPYIVNSDYISTPYYNVVTTSSYPQYNKSISVIGNGSYVTLRDKSITDVATASTTLSGKILYYAKRTPVTTTLATLTKNQVTALFAKGYCVEILGNDDNKIIVRPDLSLNMVIKLIGGNTNE